jgi:23S rRNA (cytidine1920-2'-O)/16S rRNA (cytidine1409-2'-O)-methyltransferase
LEFLPKPVILSSASPVAGRFGVHERRSVGVTTRPRLDRALVAAGLAPSRSRAQALIAEGRVRIDGEVVSRASHAVGSGAALEVIGPTDPWVSRGARKLVHALEVFGLDPTGAVALDLGASTGGFTQVLLNAGAAEVWAVDVGHGQLDPTLAADRRVHQIEGLNARALTADHVAPPDWITADLSFISLAKALPAALALARPGAVLVALIKPQFEVGPASVGKGGIVRDAAAIARARADVAAFLARAGWTIIGETESPIRGGDGNAEFLIAARKPGT